MTMNNEVRQLLVKARDGYADHGGAKLALRDVRGRVCAVGAVYEAEGEGPLGLSMSAAVTGALTVLSDAAVEQYPEYGETLGALVRVNDDPRVTPEEILAIYDKAIARVEE
jgi:hypothetical protein